MTSIDLTHTEVGGLSIAYRCAGANPTLIHLHGFLCKSRVWEPQLMDLSDQFKVVA
jgi:pimeloyl-ACP methyl ester carboxylesterase